MPNIVILGSTGSIGQQTLQVVSHLRDRFRVIGLASGDWSDVLEGQIKAYKPKWVCLGKGGGNNPHLNRVTFLYGERGLCELASVQEADIVVIAIPGMASVAPTLEAARKGKTIALASKEALVCAGDLVLDAVGKGGARLRPIDSEHSAIFQCLQGNSSAVARILLTASGGPFLRARADELERVTAQQALKHPTWKMGRKVTIDSATLMNKGFEVIEAHYLFGVGYDEIQVVIHPESIIHSMVEFADGSVLAQIGWPDMRLPIQYALTYPDRLESMIKRFNPVEVGSLTFEKPDEKRFPGLTIAYTAAKSGGTMPAVMNAADEVAVECFLRGLIRFTDISGIVRATMEEHIPVKHPSIEEIIYADKWAREHAHMLIPDWSE